MSARPDGVARNWLTAGFFRKGEEMGWIDDPSPLANQHRHLLCRGKLPGQDDDFWLSKHVEMAKIELGNGSFSSVFARGMKRGTNKVSPPYFWDYTVRHHNLRKRVRASLTERRL